MGPGDERRGDTEVVPARLKNWRTRADRVINIKDVMPAPVAGTHRPTGAALVGRWAPETRAGVTPRSYQPGLRIEAQTADRVINIKDVMPERVAGTHRPADAALVGRWAPATRAGVTPRSYQPGLRIGAHALTE